MQIKPNYLAINMFFSLNFIKDDEHFETFDVEVQNFDELLTIAREKLRCTRETNFTFLFTDGTLIDENNYLEILPIWTKLLFCKKEELNKILYFSYVKRLINTLANV